MATPTAPAPTAAPAQAPAKGPASGPTPPAAAAPVVPPPKMMKLKLDGKDVEMSEAEVISYAQQGKASGQRFQEAAAMKRQADELLKFAKDNPKEFFAKTGMNARQWAEEYLISELQIEAMSPEQKKARENEEKLRKYETDEKSRKDQETQAERDKLTNQKREEFDVMFTKALFESGLPRTPYTVKRMAELQLINIKQKLELGPGQLAKLVREDYANEQKALLGGLDGDQLLEFLGPDTVKKLSKAQISKLKAKGIQTQTSGQKLPSKKEDQELTWAQYQRRNRKIG